MKTLTTNLKRIGSLLSHKRSDAGQISGSVIIWVGISIVALTAVAWIGNTAAGSGADTANCVASFQQDRGKYGEQAPCWSSDNHSKTANETRESTSGLTGGVGGFGSSTVGGGRENVVNTSKSIQALERMLAKESGSMNEIYSNTRPILNSSTCMTTTSNSVFYSSCLRPINTLIDRAWIFERQNSQKAGSYDDVAKYLEEVNSPYKNEAKTLATRYKNAAAAMEQLNWDNDVTWRENASRTIATNRSMLTSDVARLQNIQNEWIAINNSAKALLGKIEAS